MQTAIQVHGGQDAAWPQDVGDPANLRGASGLAQQPATSVNLARRLSLKANSTRQVMVMVLSHSRSNRQCHSNGHRAHGKPRLGPADQAVQAGPPQPRKPLQQLRFAGSFQLIEAHTQRVLTSSNLSLCFPAVRIRFFPHSC
jgi:hypothetical protein